MNSPSTEADPALQPRNDHLYRQNLTFTKLEFLEREINCFLIEIEKVLYGHLVHSNANYVCIVMALPLPEKIKIMLLNLHVIGMFFFVHLIVPRSLMQNNPTGTNRLKIHKMR